MNVGTGSRSAACTARPDAEQPRGLRVVVHDRDHHRTEQLVGLLDDVDVSEVDRIEAPWIQHPQ
jgi:hypothetical protein